MGEKIKALRAAFPHTLPILTGYLALGAAHGVLLSTKGYGVVWALLTSTFIYAGSMQFVSVGMLGMGFHPLNACLMTLMVNARHLFYGISMLDRYRAAGWKKIYLIFGMCDESFSINYTAEIPDDTDRGWFMFFVTMLNHFYWVFGATLGGICGSLIHFDTEGLDFVMTAMFVVIFLEQWMKEKRHTSAVVGIAASLLCLIFFGADNFMIPAMLAMLCVLTYLRRFLEKGEEAV